MHQPEQSLLGKAVAASKHYSPQILFAISRQLGRDAIGLTQAGEVAALPFRGVDVWHGYELSWLDGKGKPVVAMARFTVPCESACIIESKSFKLYLNALNYTRFETPSLLVAVMIRDLSAAAGMAVGVELFQQDQFARLIPAAIDGVLLDTLPLCVDDYRYQPALLQHAGGENDQATEQLVSHLFRSNCPVTGQPDWATIRISYQGRPISHAAVLAYLVSFRDHQEFHEQCVERIFTDIQHHCQPRRLCVEAFFTRRGGLDICPVRCSDAALPTPLRLFRQ